MKKESGEYFQLMKAKRLSYRYVGIGLLQHHGPLP